MAPCFKTLGFFFRFLPGSVHPRCSGTPPTRRTDRDRRHPEMQMEDVEVGSTDRRRRWCRWVEVIVQGEGVAGEPQGFRRLGNLREH